MLYPAPVNESPAFPRPGFYEFFCGGGMARVGLGAAWRCLLANDFDPRKAKAYADNWGADDLRSGDIGALTGADLPGRADLAWASFPCQDLSLAGAGAGLSGARSGAFWGFHALMRDLMREERAPKIIALENVLGALTSKGGADFTALCRALDGLGYRFGALTIDAAHFVPQSRPRLFLVALRDDFSPPEALTAPAPSERFAAPALRRAAAGLPPPLAENWVWWRLPEPPRANLSLADCLDDDPEDAPWHDGEQTRAFVAAMSKASLRDLAAARARGSRQVGALFRRTRPDGAGGTTVRAEARFDGLAGCLRTPAGGSSRQFLIEVEGKATRSRLIGAREAARLMGLPESYRLPARRNDAYRLVGDGVAAPVVRFLSDHLLLPLLAAEREAARETPRARRA
jgi:DNA (cytosine-5)-methyltransferase 1